MLAPRSHRVSQQPGLEWPVCEGPRHPEAEAHWTALAGGHCEPGKLCRWGHYPTADLGDTGPPPH